MDYSFLKSKLPQSYSTPWQHFIIDEFLPADYFSKIQDQLCSVEAGYSQLEDDLLKINFMFVPNLDIAKLFLSDDFNNFLEITVNKKLTINEKGLVQLRLMNENSPEMPAHIDSADQQSLVCIYYLSPNWNKEKGGELLLHTSEHETRYEQSLVIEPRANRMVMFFTEENNWHSVTKVNGWNRFSILTEWLVQE